MRTRSFLLGAVAALTLAGAALAQYAPGMPALSSLVGPILIPVITTGASQAAIPVNGGTFACSGGAATIADTAIDGGSVIVLTLKTVGGTVAGPYVKTITPGTGFTVTCGGSDTSTYNYAIFG